MKNETFIYAINYKLITINKMLIANISKKILLKVLKNFSSSHTVTSLSQELNMSRVGIWKVLKKLESENLITLTKTGETQTGTYTISLNWKNPLTEKILSVALSEEAQKYERWRFNFSGLEKESEFFILFGSILHSPKEAADIDVLNIAKRKNLEKIKNIILKIQNTQSRKIHLTNLTKEEFEKELIELKNRILLDALKRGVILFGQESFIKFVKDI